ncbi:hypothetical protein [Trinickia diaoshuihuensis]|jgi:hypothetical protein|uniref:hypothetical protein n=1 Tax=Trinickia diaoshuihuensis TaxID=2292265 RepID=UPI000E2284E8|nr:hypothetical protein [Trinickia diaoshuihuensis]
MSDTLRKAALIESCVGAVRWVRIRVRHAAWSWRGPWQLHWTPRIAAAAVFIALAFAWTFLRIVLILVFPQSPSR